jgi:NADPH-dependent 7-cyano-7-deazaguanine reductase QueF
VLTTFPNTLETDVQIELHGEVRTVCPFDGREDVSEICLMYQPDELLIEMASFGTYLTSFAGRTITHEALTEWLYGDLHSLLRPRWLMLTDDFERDGVRLTVRMQSDLPIRSG